MVTVWLLVTPPLNGSLTLTAKKRLERKSKNVKNNIRRKKLKLTQPEAEIMFIIWKSGTTSISYADIAVRHSAYFGKPKKEAVTIRGYVHNIKCLENIANRKYLQASGEKPEKYKIDSKNCIDLQWTAIILLELNRGYQHTERQIPRDGFEQYLSEKYGWNEFFIKERIEFLEKNQYISFYTLGSESQFILVENRLEHELEYLTLIVEDYYRELHLQEPNSPITIDLKKIISLYRSDENQKTGGGIS